MRGLPLETVGLIVAVPAALALSLLGPVGVLVDRLGPRRVVMTALAAAASGALLLSRAETAPAAFLARTLTGIASAAFWPANDSLVASVVPSERRQRYFGVSFALLNAGIGVGGVMGALFVEVAHPNTFVAVYRADALTFLVPLALLAVPLRHVGGPVAHGHATAVPTTGTYGDVLRDRVFRRLLMLSFVSSFVGYGQVEGGWTAYANASARVSTRTLGIAFAVNTTIIVLLQVVVLRFIQGRPRTRMLMLQAALWAASWAILGAAGRVPATPLAAVLVVSAFGVFAVGETLDCRRPSRRSGTTWRPWPCVAIQRRGRGRLPARAYHGSDSRGLPVGSESRRPVHRSARRWVRAPRARHPPSGAGPPGRGEWRCSRASRRSTGSGVGVMVPSGVSPSTVGVHYDRSHPCRSPTGLLDGAATGLDDFGDPIFREGIEGLIDAIEHEASPNAAGRIGLAGQISGYVLAICPARLPARRLPSQTRLPCRSGQLLRCRPERRRRPPAEARHPRLA